MENNIKKAIAWFKLNDIHAFSDDEVTTMYVDVYGMDCTTVELSKAEINYRAELFDEVDTQ